MSAVQETSPQLEYYAVLRLLAADAMVTNNLNDFVEQRGADTLLGVVDPGADVRAVRRMASEEYLLKPSRHRRVAERDPGQLGVVPPQYPSALGGPEPASKNVVEASKFPCQAWWQSNVENSRAKPSKSEKFAPSIVRTGKSSPLVTMTGV